ncbi:DUF2971 domain-containing protein [Mycobacterium sp. 2YAF39]|uniref:DUF2971 domain-containing protein n=1 Tax=Mycobacterium sp. 2YAF39 TaxID=3233033 RepID=UPI003F9D39C3
MSEDASTSIAAEEDVDEEEDEDDEDVDNEDEEDPSVLYHYTNAQGFLGIVNPSWPQNFKVQEQGDRMLRFLASDVRFMNDTQELRFGVRRLRNRLLRAAKDSATPEESREAFTDMAQYLDPDGVLPVLEWPQRCFATCFCAEGDLLSQWKGYTGGVGGFAIGISKHALEYRTLALHREGSSPEYQNLVETTLRPVVYGKKAATVALDEHIQSVIAMGLKSPLREEVPLAQGQARGQLFTALIEAVITIKARSFREEKEWRLFSMNHMENLVDVRARANGLVPYVDFAVDHPESGSEQDPPSSGQIIHDVIVGPGPDQAEQFVAARELLRLAGHQVQVRASKISYRGW